MLAQYREEAARRVAAGVPPLPLGADQTRELTRLLTGDIPNRTPCSTCSPNGWSPG